MQIVLAVLEEKEGALGDKFADDLVKTSSWLKHLLFLSNEAPKRDKVAVKAISKIVAASVESENKPPAFVSAETTTKSASTSSARSCKLAGFLWSEMKKKHASDLTKIRIPFLSAVLPHKKNCSVVTEIATVVAKSRQDIVSVALDHSANAKSELVSLLLNYSQDAAAKTLAAAIIDSVQDWTSLISHAQLPQTTLGCFLALKQITQRHPELLTTNKDKNQTHTMSTIIDSATRHFLKQTLSAAESAKVAVKLRMMNKNSNNNDVSSKKLLKVVDSSDDEDGDNSKTAGARRARSASKGKAVKK